MDQNPYASPKMTEHTAVADGNTAFLRAARAGNLDKVLEYLKSNIDINTSNANGLNALHLASKDGHVNVVTELLKRGATVDAATKKGNTALHIASLAGQEEVVKILVQNGASVNVQSQNGFTPLYMAAQENHDNVVRFLLANGANQSLATEDGFTPLAVAMQQGHDKVVTVLLENDTRGKVRLPALHIAAKKDDCKAAALLLQNDHNPDVTSKSGFTPLHIAAHYGNENIANLLLQRGADVNYSAKHNITPLHVAAKWGKTNMVSLLIEKGANIEAKTRDGLTPLHCAARSGHEQVVDMLLERGAPISSKTKNGLAPLHMASQGDHVDAARILLYHRAPVDEVTVDYLTALHVAAHCGHVRVAKLLLDRKADPNARALNGFTPLHIACKKNRIKVVELLLKHGASIEATTESGLTPLHVASFMGCMNIVIYLIQHEANPDVPTVRGETPLHLAARANQADIIRILLRNGAQVDARAREQQTPLHIASRLGNVDIVMLLLQHGAAVDATTKDMYTALHIAAKEGQEEVASVLLEHGASLTATTKKGFTPLHLAAKYGKMKVARLLLQRDAPVDAQGKNGVTPLHVASHYDHQNVALLLLDKGASPHATAKNGHTPLHIAARKNQMDIATTLLEYGAKANAESKAGFTPLHLSSQEGHTDMSTLLIEHQADPNHKAKNGLTPLHLCAQEDRVNVATILVKNGAEVDAKTKAGYTPLHVACHFGQINMVRFLLQHGVDVNSATSAGYTPLHQAAQQGHVLIINLLLESRASPNAVTNQGQTALSIAQKLGYISVVETLKVVTETVITTTTTITTEEKYRVMAPETMQETFMSDSEDEGGEDTMLSDQPYRYLTVDEMKSLGDDSLPIDVTRDERGDSNRDSMAPPTAMEDSISPQHSKEHYSQFSSSYAPDNVDIARHPVHVGFLVSFMVDARGGAMRGCRHSGVRVIVPPRKAAMPMRITCRYLKKDKLAHPPPLMEGEALASRILELGPVAAKFLGPVIIEVPHFGSLRGKEREIVILRSDNGETWREHTLEASEEAIQDVLNESFDGEELTQLEDLNTNRITRILTTDFPQYFAIVSRVRQEVHAIGPEGGMVSSTVVPQVQAVFPQGALTKKIKVGLQAQPISAELVAKLLGNRVAVSPIVTVEPRRRKFHKPITLTIPVPQAANKGMINQYSGDAPTLRLLCSITGGTTRAQWEDVTGSTPLTFVNDCVSFTTTVSARFWLMDCRNIAEATKMATELYKEAIHVPFMAKFVVFAKRVDVLEARLRVFCMTDDKEDKTLEHQEHFTEVAKSRDVEVLEGKSQFVEFAGNLVPVTKSGDQLQLGFHAFKENRLPFTVRVKDPHADTVGRILFMREPKVAKGEPPQSPICILNIVLPETITPEMAPSEPDLLELEKKYSFLRDGSLSRTENIHKADLRLSDICNLLGLDWIQLANELGIAQDDIHLIQSEYPDSVPQQAMVMLRLWMQQSGNKATGNTLEKSLRKINREDIVDRCIFNVELVTDDMEKAVAKVRLDQSGFDNLKEELGPSRDTSLRRNVSLDVTYDEQDIMKESESVEELVAAEKIVTPKEDRLAHESEVEAKDSIREKDVGAEKIGDEVRKSIKDYEREEQKYVGEEKEYKEFEEALMKDAPKPVHEEITKKRGQEEVKEAAFVKDESKKSPTIMAGMADDSGDDKKRKADMIAEITEELGRLDTSYKGGAPMPVKEAVTSPKISKTPPPSPAEFKEGTVMSTKVTHEFPARDIVVGEEHTEYITPDGTTVRQTTITKTTIVQGAEPSITEEAAQLAESETWQSDDQSTHPEELSSVQVTPQDDSTVAESLESDGFKEHFPLETPPVERHPFEAGSESEETPEVELVSLRVAQLHDLFTYQKPTSKQKPEGESKSPGGLLDCIDYTSPPEEKGSKDSKRSECEKENLNARPQRRKEGEPTGLETPPPVVARLTGGITPEGEAPSDGEPGRGGVGGSDQPDDGGGGPPSHRQPPQQPEDQGPARGDSDRVDRGTSPLDETTSPVSVHGGGRGQPPTPHAESPLVERAPAPPPRAPTLELVIGRKEVHTRDASASSESRLTLYGAQEFVRGFEISIRSQSHISVTTTTKESGKETSQRVDVGLTTSAGTGRRSTAFSVPTPPEEMGVARGDVVEEEDVSRGADEVTSAEGREYVVRHPDDDGLSFGGKDSDVQEKFETEVKEKKRETLGGGETVIFSGEKSIYHYESQDVGGYSPFESPTTESAAHITDTGIGMTRTDTATTDTDTVTSPVHRPPISDTAVDTEAELTDAGFSPIQTEVAVPGLDFFRDNVTYSDAAISPVYAAGVTVALSPLQVETSEAGVLTDAIETRDAGISPVKLSLSESTSPISIEGPTAQTQIPERMDVASSPITKEMMGEKPKSVASVQSIITPFTSVQTATLSTFQLKTIPSSQDKSLIRDRPAHMQQVISSRPKEVEEIVERRRRDSGDVKTMVRMLEEGSLPRPPEDTPPEKVVAEEDFISADIGVVKDSGRIDSTLATATVSMDSDKLKSDEKIKYYDTESSVQVETKKKKQSLSDSPSKAVITHTKNVGPKIKQLQRFFTQESESEKIIDKDTTNQEIPVTKDKTEEEKELNVVIKMPPKAKEEEVSPIEEDKEERPAERRDAEIAKLIQSMELSLEPPEKWTREKVSKIQKRSVIQERKTKETVQLPTEVKKEEREIYGEKVEEKKQFLQEAKLRDWRTFPEKDDDGKGKKRSLHSEDAEDSDRKGLKEVEIVTKITGKTTTAVTLQAQQSKSEISKEIDALKGKQLVSTISHSKEELEKRQRIKDDDEEKPISVVALKKSFEEKIDKEVQSRKKDIITTTKQKEVPIPKSDLSKGVKNYGEFEGQRLYTPKERDSVADIREEKITDQLSSELAREKEAKNLTTDTTKKKEIKTSASLQETIKNQEAQERKIKREETIKKQDVVEEVVIAEKVVEVSEAVREIGEVKTVGEEELVKEVAEEVKEIVEVTEKKPVSPLAEEPTVEQAREEVEGEAVEKVISEVKDVSPVGAPEVAEERLPSPVESVTEKEEVAGVEDAESAKKLTQAEVEVSVEEREVIASKAESVETITETKEEVREEVLHEVVTKEVVKETAKEPVSPAAEELAPEEAKEEVTEVASPVSEREGEPKSPSEEVAEEPSLDHVDEEPDEKLPSAADEVTEVVEEKLTEDRIEGVSAEEATVVSEEKAVTPDVEEVPEKQETIAKITEEETLEKTVAEEVVERKEVVEEVVIAEKVVEVSEAVREIGEVKTVGEEELVKEVAEEVKEIVEVTEKKPVSPLAEEPTVEQAREEVEGEAVEKVISEVKDVSPVGTPEVAEERPPSPVESVTEKEEVAGVEDAESAKKVQVETVSPWVSPSVPDSEKTFPVEGLCSSFIPVDISEGVLESSYKRVSSELGIPELSADIGTPSEVKGDDVSDSEALSHVSTSVDESISRDQDFGSRIAIVSVDPTNVSLLSEDFGSISTSMLEQVPSISNIVDPCSKDPSFDIQVAKDLSSAGTKPFSGAFSEIPLGVSYQESIELTRGLSEDIPSSVPEEIPLPDKISSGHLETVVVQEIREGTDKLSNIHQTVIPESTVGTLCVPISEDGESQSDIVGSQASASTLSDVSDEPRRPFLSKSRREQLSILTKRVLSEKEMKELMIEVKEVTRQIKQEVKELKPDLTPTPEGISFPSQAFMDDSESSLTSIMEEHQTLVDSSQEVPGTVKKSHVPSRSDIGEIGSSKIMSLDDENLQSLPQTGLETKAISQESEGKHGMHSDAIDRKDVKVVTIIEEEVVLDNVMETVIDEIQTVEKKIVDDSESRSKAAAFESVDSQSVPLGSSDLIESHSTDKISESELKETRFSVKTSILEEETASCEDLIPVPEVESTAILNEVRHTERTDREENELKTLDSQTEGAQLSIEIKAASHHDEQRELLMDAKKPSPTVSPTKETLTEEAVTVKEDMSPLLLEVLDEKPPQKQVVCPYTGDSHQYRPILDVTSEDIVLKDDDTIEITVSEDPSQIYSTTSTHATVETTMHTSASGATFVEVNRDGQRSICVCEKIVQSQTLVPKESTSHVKHPPETPSTSKKSSKSGIGKARQKESSDEHFADRKRSIEATKTSAELPESGRRHLTSSKPSTVTSDSEGMASRKKFSTKSYRSSYEPPSTDSHRKAFSSQHGTQSAAETLPRERTYKKSHYAEDTASSSSKKIMVTHRREESQHSRSYRTTRDTSESSDKSPALRKPLLRKDGEFEQPQVLKKRPQEIDKKTSGKEDTTKDRSTSSRKVTASGIPGPSHGGHTESRELSTSRKSTSGKSVPSKLTRSSIPTKRKEASKGESEVPTAPYKSPIVASSSSMGRHTSSTITQRSSSSRVSDRSIGTTVKPIKKISSQVKVPKPEKSSPDRQAVIFSQKISPAPSESTQPASTPKLPVEDVQPEISPSETDPKVEDSSPESSVTVMTSSPSPSVCQPSFGIPDSSSPTPSLPSSPSRMRYSSAASGTITQLMTSEVFTRTLDVTGAIEVIYRQPTTSESLRRIAPSKSTQLSGESTATPSGAMSSFQIDSSQVDTTDSSLSDSVALPSSSSDFDFSSAQDGYRQVLSRSGTFAPSQRTSHPTTPSHLSPSPSSIILPQPTHRRSVRTTQVSEERLSPILDVRAVTPPRVKHKFEYMAGDEVEEAGEHPQEWAEKMQQKHSAGHGGPATEDAGFHALHDAVAPPNQDSSSIIRTDVVAHDVFPDGNEVDFMNQKDWNTYGIGETPIGHLDTTSHHKDPIQIIRTVVCETSEKNVPLGFDSLEQFTEPSFPPNDFRYNALGDKKGDNQDSNSDHTIFEAGPQIAQHILAATSTPSRPVRHSDGKSHTTNADNCKEEDEQESCQRDAFSDGGDSNMVDSESDGGESPLAVPKMRIKRTSRTVGSSSGSDFEDDASTSPVESSEGLALFTVSGSEFYQTQDPESTSEYDPSQTTTQARVVTTRTLTRTVMGEDGRPVSVTTTETEVSDGGGAEGVLDSNQLRESMQQIIDQFASGEEMKEGKESKEEKKPE